MKRNQLTTLYLLLVIVACWVSYPLVQTSLQDNNTEQKSYQISIADEKINPNIASWASMARLPGIGETRAKAIVAFREKEIDKNKIVFQSVDDLSRIKGIGEKTVDKLKPYIDCHILK